jgi:Fe-S cluster assembly protein SufD
MFLELLEKQQEKGSLFFEHKFAAQKKAFDLNFPTKKTESFSYLNLKELESQNLLFTSTGYTLSSSCKGVEILSLAAALEKYGLLISNRIEKMQTKEKSFFSLVNQGWTADTYCIFVQNSTGGIITIEEEFFGDNKMVCPQLQFFIGKDVEATFHHKIKVSGKDNFINRSSYISLEKGAKITTFETPLIQRENSIFFHTEAFLKKDSIYNHKSGVSTLRLYRNEIKAYLLEENATANLEGFWNGSKDDSLHYHVHCSHLAEYTNSRQHFQGVLQESARASFEGQIYVDRIAQKTDSYQLSKHLLIGEDARAFSKPNLEVFADDVIASHGATISPLNEEELYFLCSRGISKQKACDLLKQGFLTFFLESIKDKEVLESFMELI